MKLNLGRIFIISFFSHVFRRIIRGADNFLFFQDHINSEVTYECKECGLILPSGFIKTSYEICPCCNNILDTIILTTTKTNTKDIDYNTYNNDLLENMYYEF